MPTGTALQVPRLDAFAHHSDHWHRLTEDQWQRLAQRRMYLAERIKAKKVVGWETIYDQSEHDALAAALPLLRYFVQ